jgi:hypothetical protein
VQRKWLLRALLAIFAVLVLVGIYKAIAGVLEEHPVTWSQLTEWRPAPIPLLASLVLLTGVFVAHALLWRRLLRDLQIGSPSRGTAARIYFVSGLARYIPFVKLAALAGMAVLAKRAGLPPASSAAAALLGQFGFLTTGFLYIGVMVPAWGGRAGLGFALGALLLVVAAAGWILVATPLGHGFRMEVVRRAGDGRVGEKVGAAFALADRVRPRHALVWGLSYAATWFLLGLAFAIFVSAFVPSVWQHARIVAGTVAAAYLAGYFAFFLPAGLGAREAVMIALLSQIVPSAAAIVISVSSRVWFTAAELIPLLALPVMGSEPKLEREDG